ncbi:MAG: addiction module toxin, HicA family [Desulfovibrionaceae bacterium]|nr:MAG: addiction module toxin, HicA family [Desulfovibrionaceae bacterium]
MSCREVIKRLLEDGWTEVKPRTPGSHRQFRHPVKKGKVTVPEHGARDIPIGTLKKIEKQSGLKLR